MLQEKGYNESVNYFRERGHKMNPSFIISRKFKSVVYFLLAAFLLLLAPITIHANDYNPYIEIDTVSKDPYSVYTLYLGMPESDFNENFKNIPWSKIEDYTDNDGRHVGFTRTDSTGVTESLAVILSNNQVVFFLITMYGDDLDEMISLERSALTNLKAALGTPAKFNYSPNDETMSATWNIGDGQILNYGFGKMGEYSDSITTKIDIVRSFINW